jgi:hypothetical protein
MYQLQGTLAAKFTMEISQPPGPLISDDRPIQAPKRKTLVASRREVEAREPWWMEDF